MKGWKSLSLVGMAALSLTVGAGQVGAADTVELRRLAGADRYATAAAVALDGTFTSSRTAALASGASFPDALAAGTLGFPVLLTEPDGLPPVTTTALDALRDRGVSDVVVIGGTNAVSATVEAQVRDRGFRVRRFAGPDRYATAAAVATEAPAGTISGAAAAMVVSGESFPDALAAGAVAAGAGLPLLLARYDGVPDSTRAELDRRGTRRVLLIGGVGVLPRPVADALETRYGQVTRVAGDERYETASDLAEFAFSSLGFPPEEVVLASALRFPDGVAAGAFAGRLRAPILLADDHLPNRSSNVISTRNRTMVRVWVVGGTSAVSERAAQQAQAAATTGTND